MAKPDTSGVNAGSAQPGTSTPAKNPNNTTVSAGRNGGAATQAATAAGGGTNAYGPGRINKPQVVTPPNANAAAPDVSGAFGNAAAGLIGGLVTASGQIGNKDETPTGTLTRTGGGGRGGGGGGGGAAPGIGQSYNANTKLNIKTADPADQQRLREALSAELNPEVDPAHVDRVDYFDKQPLIDNLTQEIEAARQQTNTAIDRNVDTQALALQRALAEAQGQFQTQQNQVTAQEMNALDNAALYAEARGDKGGIGQAQYNAIQNTAAQNRFNIQQAQTKAATDMAQQISDLRAQGEFERADKMLAVTQQYLQELRQIETFAAEFNLNVDQLNTAISEWEQEFDQNVRQYRTSTEMSLAQLTGKFSNGTPTYEAQQTALETTAQLALSLLQAGVKPTQLSPVQLSALAEYYGMNQSSINNFFRRANW